MPRAQSRWYLFHSSFLTNVVDTGGFFVAINDSSAPVSVTHGQLCKVDINDDDGDDDNDGDGNDDGEIGVDVDPRSAIGNKQMWARFRI